MRTTSLKSIIGQLNEQFDAAFNRGDSATLASLYTPDGVLLPPGAVMQKGREAIAVFWDGMAREYGELKLTTVDLKQYGDTMAREIGQLTVKRKAPPEDELSGKYVVIWEKIQDQWKLAVDIANFDSEG